ncbi:MAG: hypothetical protein HFH87_00965 [Lachnospiraceae bacterium]|nr:hypothetical protein [Lachnospiraceae bacterium]
MNKIEKQILEEYSINYSIAAMSYEIMGIMIDARYVEERLREFNISSMYIYGGTYMGVQLYKIGKKVSNVCGIVDKYGKIVGNEKISLMMLDELSRVYKGEKIVVTSIRFFKEICSELEMFVDRENIIGIGELLLGRTWEKNNLV